MASPRIIIADSDINYIAPIHLKFVEEFFDKIQLEVITDKDYYYGQTKVKDWKNIINNGYKYLSR